MTQALLVIDVQRDYFAGGGCPLVEPDRAAETARRVLDVWHTERRPVFHMQHVWDAPEATYMRPGTAGVEIHPLVEPRAGEKVIVKRSPNSFLNTPLLDELRSAEVDELTVVGMMTNICVDATVRAASDLGFDVTVVHDACAASDVIFGDRSVDGATVHAAFMASFADDYARVVSADELLRDR